jgi:hypothetical protein
MSEDIQYKYLKLTSGDGIICTTTDDLTNLFEKTSISVTDPIVLNPIRVPRGEVLVESYIMYPFFSFSNETIYEIPTKQIVLAVTIKDTLKDTYLQYLKTQAEKEKEEDDDPIIIDDDEEENESLLDQLLNALGDDIHEENERHDDFITGRTRRTSRILH